MRHFQYESRRVRPISAQRFYRRVARHFLVVAVILTISLAIGMAGYAYFERWSWTDDFLNAAMLLGGMGPVNAPLTEGGKLFAGFYALFAGLVFIMSTGILIAPVVHRVFHLIHWEE